VSSLSLSVITIAASTQLNTMILRISIAINDGVALRIFSLRRFNGSD
jgi:hypothetical protein